ncbi:MAG: arsenate reductase ArsC [Bacteroidia bacterium]|nr:arsenate reductase ArsC [Bacteroidia bacterium]
MVKVLFICVHNSARSQMAEAFLNQIGGDRFYAESAGFEPGALNPLVVEAMAETGIDISMKQSKEIFDLYRQGRSYNYVISVCDEAHAEKCPIFPGLSKRLVWSFEDPSSFTGSKEEQMEKVRILRDKIKSEIENFNKNYEEIEF